MKLHPSAAWHELATCRDADPEMFFVRPADRKAIAAAKRVCLACPVRQECARYAAEHEELEGIWGGTTERERTADRLRARLSLPATTPA